MGKYLQKCYYCDENKFKKINCPKCCMQIKCQECEKEWSNKCNKCKGERYMYKFLSNCIYCDDSKKINMCTKCEKNIL